MAASLPHPPFELDPLIAEAKRRTRKRRLLLLGALVATAATAGGLVLALRPPSPSTSESSAGNGSNVSSVAPCTKLALGDAVSTAVRGKGYSAELINGAFSCSKGWATAMVNEGSGAVSVTATFVFRSQHHVWRRQLDRAKVCDTHQVPRAIYWNACQTN
jgi:hypothetical protein